MKRIEEIIDLIEITGDKCVILHKERGAYVVMKLDDYRQLVIKRQKVMTIVREKGDFPKYNDDIKEFEVREEDRFYPEPLED